jgi:translation initiation factor 1
VNNNLFEIESKFEETWVSDNRSKPKQKPPTQIKAPQKHRLHLAKEKRRGKTVTIVKPFHLNKSNLQALLKILKKKLSTGGTLRDEALEFQGDMSDILRSELEVLNYRFKK